MTPFQEYETVLEPVEVVDGELVDEGEVSGAGGDVAVHDPVAAVLAALDTKAAENLYEDRPDKTKKGYARDWQLWQEFHGWLAEQTGVRLPDSALTVGTFVGFVKWLDQVKEAAPTSIERRVTGVASEARRYGHEVPKAARAAATQALKPLKLDKKRQQRGRGKASPLTPADLRKMANAPRERAPQPGARKRRTLVISELTRLRDKALNALKFAVAGRNEEMSALDDADIVPVDEGLMVHVPSVKGRPPRDAPVTYGEHADTCPVRCWNAYRAAKLAAGAAPGGPAFLPVDQWGHQGKARLSPDGVGRALARCAKYAGITGRRITGHSARRGLVTTGRKKGKRVEKLRSQGGWSPNSPVFWEYVDEGEAFEDAATEGIGL
jgi:integrase